MQILETPSPNCDARSTDPEIIVLHYTGMASGWQALQRLQDPAAEVSAHYLVEEDGRIFRLVPEELRAWHAGRSFWRGRRNVNGISIGIEIVNPGHTLGYRPFPAVQIAAVTALVEAIRTRWSIDDRDIVGHSDIAPLRKEDPGELFPWAQLARAGHGLWPKRSHASCGVLCEGDEGQAVLALQAAMFKLGYDIAPSGAFDAETVAVMRAFQRHWRQDQVDGRADGPTRATLRSVLSLAYPRVSPCLSAATPLV